MKKNIKKAAVMVAVMFTALAGASATTAKVKLGAGILIGLPDIKVIIENDKPVTTAKPVAKPAVNNPKPVAKPAPKPVVKPCPKPVAKPAPKKHKKEPKHCCPEHMHHNYPGFGGPHHGPEPRR